MKLKRLNLRQSLCGMVLVQVVTLLFCVALLQVNITLNRRIDKMLKNHYLFVDTMTEWQKEFVRYGKRIDRLDNKWHDLFDPKPNGPLIRANKLAGK